LVRSLLVSVSFPISLELPVEIGSEVRRNFIPGFSGNAVAERLNLLVHDLPTESIDV
jgi:hypothetical protein